MRRFLLAVFLVLALVHPVQAFRRVGGSPIPPAARAAGYLTETFSNASNFSSSNVDLGMTYSSGYKWYVWNFFGATPALNGTEVNSNGTITVGSGPGNGNIASAAVISDAPYYVGTAFGGGAYIEATFSFNPIGAAFPPYPSSTEWPAWWTMAVEHLANLSGQQWAGQTTGYYHFIENDIFEFLQPVSSYAYDSTLHDWYGIYDSSCPPGFCAINSNNYAPLNNANITNIPIGTDYTLNHRYGMLWVPATGSANGSIAFYFDDIQVLPTIYYSQFTNQSPPPSLTTPWTFGIIDQQHLVLILGGGGNPLIVKSVAVWQASSAGNLHN